jgi:DNA segregation ATPase FtsK/SpoIIIE, S-DNA-T family
VQIVMRMGDEEREVVVDRRAPDAVVGDLLAALGVDADGIDVDGRFVDRGEGLADAPIPDGALVTPAAMHGPVGRTRPNAPAWLTVVAGAGSGDRLPLRQGTLVLGRAADCDLRLDSPTVSERHALLHVDATVQVEDANSSNGTWVDGHPVGRPVIVEVGDTIRVGAVVLRLDGPDLDDMPTGIDRHLLPGNIPFNRPPRPALPPAVPTLAAPPKASDDKRGQPLRIAAMLAPLAMAGALIAITGNIRFALFALLSPVMVLGNWISTRRHAKKENTAASAAHRAAVAQFATDLAATQRAERHRREAVATDLGEVLRRVLWPTVRLWERRLHHDDALRLRIGSADVAWDPPVRLPDGEPAPEVTDLLTTRGRLPTAPVEVELGPGHVVGIVGDRAAGLALARSLLVQATVLHGPADLRLGVFAQPTAASDWQWTAWLPHTHDPSGRIRLLSADHEVSEQILGGILDGWRATTDQRPGTGGLAVAGQAQTVGGPVSLWVVDDLELLTGRRAPARDLLAGAGPPTCGIVLAPTEDRLPSSCTVVIDARSDMGDARVHWPARAERCDDVLLAGLDAPRARQAARALAHFEDPELQVSGGTVPTLVRLLPLLGMEEVTADDVARAWTQDLPDPGPNGPIGVGEDGPVHLNLVTDGPHGLVGGTTGSGKSEMLRSLVAGMAARVDPEHLVFVLVDYKGGSAFDECARLPHTVGMVTDLDEHLGERALTSLEAELHHRERLLRDAGVADLPEYLRAGAPLGPLPRMVVVIDEFATMASELPDFLDALVGIAQRGRSLGVHMILATQRPKGAVNANIKANTNLRIALRVQDAADSTDIIDRADAAELDRATPGRAWIRRGHGDLTLVQTALSTAPAGRTPGEAVALGDLRFAPTSAPPPPPSGGDDGPTDLGLLVEACRAAFDRSGMAPPRRPWLPMLDDDLPLDEVLAAWAGVRRTRDDGRDDGGRAPGGGRGAVRHGRRSGGAGTAAVRVAARRRSPRGLRDGRVGHDDRAAGGRTGACGDPHTRCCHVYGLDFGGGGLAALADLPHCGASCRPPTGRASSG